jgi:hypothetical protein
LLSIAVKSIAVEWPSCRPSPSSCRRAVHHHQVAIAVHCRQSIQCYPPVAVTPSNAVESIAVKLPARRPLQSIAIHRPSPLSCRCIIHCCPCHQAVYYRRIAIVPSTAHRRPASITYILSIAVALSIAVKPSIAVAPSTAFSHPAGCCVTSCHADASHPPVQEFSQGMFNLFLMCGTIL